MRKLRAKHAAMEIGVDKRENIAMVRNVLILLDRMGQMIGPRSMMLVINEVARQGLRPKDLLDPKNANAVITQLFV